jgi:hypothetical protein
MKRSIDIASLFFGADVAVGVASMVFALVGLMALWSILVLAIYGTDVALAACRRWARTSTATAVLALAAARAAYVSWDVVMLLAFAAFDCWLVLTFGGTRPVPRAQARLIGDGRLPGARPR